MKLLASALLSASFAFGAWVELRPPTGPFVVLTETPEPGRIALNQLEQFRYALGLSIGQQELKSTWPIVIVVAKPSKGFPPPTLGLARGAYVSTFPPSAAPPPAWWRSLARILLESTLPGRMPPGYEAALGAFYSTLEVKGVRLTVGVPPPTPERTPVWALIHMLTTTPETSGRVRVLLTNLAQGADSDAAFRNAFELPETQLLAKADAYLKAGVFNSSPLSGRALDPDRFKQIPASPNQVKLLPGDLLVAAKAPEAEIRPAYQNAVEQGALAGGHEGLGYFDQSEFAAAIRIEGASAHAWLEYGRLLKDPVQAQAAFEKAAQLNPNWAEPHFRIAEIADTPGKKAFALKKAVAAEPRNLAYWRAYAEALENQKNYAEAVKAWRGAERAATSEAERVELRRIAQQRGDLRAEQEAAERRRQAEEERAEVERLRLENLQRIRAAESKANQTAGAVKDPAKVQQWWDGPPLTKVSGTLVRVDCLGKQARLVLQVPAGQPIQLLVTDPSQIVIMGGGEKTFGCGPQKPPRSVNVEYVPKPNAKLATAGEAQVVEFPLMRWVIFSVFILSSVLNFLDRQVLAALAPELMREFSLNKGQYGDLISVFSLTYAAAAPLLGWFIDRVGLTRGSTFLVGLWSMAGMATGLAQGYGGLVAARGALGFAEAGSVPSVGKANVMYLQPRERSMGTAVNQIGLTLGAVLAPLAGQWMSSHFGWRSAFVLTGFLGFLWIPLWIGMARRAPVEQPATGKSMRAAQVLRDSRFWLLLAANMAVMAIYSLWVNWTTVFLVAQHGLTQIDANQRLAWLPQIFGTLGGLFGGWLALRWAANGVVAARLRASLVGCLLALVTALIPFAPTPGYATAGICLSFFAVLIASVNVYALPLDYFGAGPAAFAISGLTCSYGVVQTIFSSTAGRIADQFGFTPVLLALAPLPLIGWLLLWISAKR